MKPAGTLVLFLVILGVRFYGCTVLRIFASSEIDNSMKTKLFFVNAVDTQMAQKFCYSILGTCTSRWKWTVVKSLFLNLSPFWFFSSVPPRRWHKPWKWNNHLTLLVWKRFDIEIFLFKLMPSKFNKLKNSRQIVFFLSMDDILWKHSSFLYSAVVEALQTKFDRESTSVLNTLTLFCWSSCFPTSKKEREVKSSASQIHESLEVKVASLSCSKFFLWSKLLKTNEKSKFPRDIVNEDLVMNHRAVWSKSGHWSKRVV